ncbi:unnamed protein product [Periconia digitata]|uniref:Uncharacterized protein n=1 Tax=Periconia digitata TaxID=1303443 RepID=A0A9W4UBL2_9PLEO|nr:unnamed protein product [Periconia digitata]
MIPFDTRSHKVYPTNCETLRKHLHPLESNLITRENFSVERAVFPSI